MKKSAITILAVLSLGGGATLTACSNSNPPVEEISQEIPIEASYIQEIQPYVSTDGQYYTLSSETIKYVSSEAYEFGISSLEYANGLIDTGDFTVNLETLQLEENLDLSTQRYNGGISWSMPGCGQAWIGSYLEWWGYKTSMDHCAAWTVYSAFGLAGPAAAAMNALKLAVASNPYVVPAVAVLSIYAWWIKTVDGTNGRGANLMTNWYGTMWVQKP